MKISDIFNEQRVFICIYCNNHGMIQGESVRIIFNWPDRFIVIFIVEKVSLYIELTGTGNVQYAIYSKYVPTQHSELKD